jgi:hypothetical protein
MEEPVATTKRTKKTDVTIPSSAEVEAGISSKSEEKRPPRKRNSASENGKKPEEGLEKVADEEEVSSQTPLKDETEEEVSLREAEVLISGEKDSSQDEEYEVDLNSLSDRQFKSMLKRRLDRLCMAFNESRFKNEMDEVGKEYIEVVWPLVLEGKRKEAIEAFDQMYYGRLPRASTSDYKTAVKLWESNRHQPALGAVAEKVQELLTIAGDSLDQEDYETTYRCSRSAHRLMTALLWQAEQKAKEEQWRRDEGRRMLESSLRDDNSRKGRGM